MQVVNWFKAVDGKVFETQAECLEHEAEAARADKVGKFHEALKEAGYASALTMARAAGVYLAWADGKGVKSPAKGRASNAMGASRNGGPDTKQE